MKIKDIKNLCYYDTETSGLDFVKDRILEHGCIRIRDGKIVDTLQMIVKQNVYICPEVIAIHGIDRAKVDREGIDPKVAAQKVIDFLGDDIVSGLNNIPFDYPMLENECKRHSVSLPKIENWIDLGMLHKGVCLGNMYNEQEMFYKYAWRIRDVRARIKFNLNLLVKTYGVENLRAEGLHGAIEDGTMCHFVFEEFRKKYYTE